MFFVLLTIFCFWFILSLVLHLRGFYFLRLSFMEDLKKFREEINEIDDAIICLLGERMEIIRNIGKHKKENNLPITDKIRFKEILNTLSDQGKEYGLSGQMIKEIYETIHQYAIKEQEKIK